MKTLKAGTVLINLQNKEICLVYNKNDKSYAFPKGHLENGETLKECAIRETEEETGHTCSIINEKEIGILKFNSCWGKCRASLIFSQRYRTSY